MDRQTSTLERSFGKLAKTMTAVFAGVQVANFVKDSTKAFIDFENGMNEVFTLLPNISNEAMEEMTDQVKKFSKEAGVLPEKTVPALYQALSAGVPKDNVFSFLETANKAAVGGVTNLETAVDGLTTVVNSYGADVIDVNKASDLMFTTVKLGKTNFEQLSQSLFNVLPSASAAGVKFEDVSAALATLTAQGVPTSVATTKIRTAIDEMSKSGTEVSNKFKELTGKSFKEFLAEGKNIQDAFQILERHAKATGKGINDLFSSQEAGSAALALTGKSTEMFTNALNEMNKASGATDAAFGKMEQGLKRKIEKLKANFEVFKLQVGGRAAGALNVLFDAGSKVSSFLRGKFNSALEKLKKTLQPVSKPISNFKQSLKDIFRHMKMGLSVTTSFSAPLKHLEKIFEGLFGKKVAKVAVGALKLMFKSIDKSIDFFKKLSGTLLNSVRPLVDGFISGFKNMIPTLKGVFNELSPIFLDVGSSIGDALNKIIPTLGDILTKTQTRLSKITPVFMKVFNTISKIILPIFTDAFNFIVNTVIPAIVPIINKTVKSVSQTIQKLLPAIGSIVSAVLKIVPVIIDIGKYLIEKLMPIFSSVFGFITDRIIPIFTAAFESIAPKVSSIVQNVIIAIQGLWNFIKPVIDLLVGAIQFALPLIQDIITIAINTVIGVFDGLLNTLNGIIEFVVGVFTGDWEKAWQGVKDIFGGIFGTLGSLLKAPLNGVIALINQAIRGINKLDIKVPDWVPGLGGKGFDINIPEIPMLAKGTNNFAGGIAIVGEKGPELVNLPKGSQVIPNNKTEQILSQTLNPVDIPKPKDLTQTIRQKLIPANIQQPSSLIQMINQVLNAINIPKPRDLTQIVKQKLIPADFSQIRENNNMSVPLPSSIKQNSQDNKVEQVSQDKNINININGNGSIKIDPEASKEAMLNILLENVKPVLMNILQEEIFEEGELSYDF